MPALASPAHHSAAETRAVASLIRRQRTASRPERRRRVADPSPPLPPRAPAPAPSAVTRIPPRAARTRCRSVTARSRRLALHRRSKRRRRCQSRPHRHPLPPFRRRVAVVITLSPCRAAPETQLSPFARRPRRPSPPFPPLYKYPPSPFSTHSIPSFALPFPPRLPPALPAALVPSCRPSLSPATLNRAASALQRLPPSSPLRRRERPSYPLPTRYALLG